MTSSSDTSTCTSTYSSTYSSTDTETNTHAQHVHSPEALALAQRAAAHMFEADVASRDTIGMTLEQCVPGQAQLSMTVQAKHLNGLGICHGGFIFTLADSAFAFACNSRNQATVAAGCSIEFLEAARLGDVLHATATEQALRGRAGIYDIAVRKQDGTTIALFRGKSMAVKGTVLPA
jgi:acyl-CoA thioesterase